MSDQTYQETLAAYTAQLRGLFAAPEGGLEAEARRGVSVDPGVLGERASTLADLSLSLGNQTSAFLDSDSRAVREAAEMKLLAQANAEMEVASALLAAVEDVASPPGEPRRAGGAAADAARSVEDLAGVLEAPLESGLTAFMEVQPARGGPSDPAEAISELSDQVRRSLRDITRQASRANSFALDTLFSLDASLLKRAVAPVNKEIADVIEKAAQALNEKIKSLLKSAARLLLQAYDWVLALIGKDAEAQARKKVQGWIEELRSSYKKQGDAPDLAEQLVSGLFITDIINGEVAQWAKDSKAGAEAVNTAAEAVRALADSYSFKTSRVQLFLKGVSAIPKGATAAVAALTTFNPAAAATVAGLLPAIEVLRAAITMGLMGYTLFSGYDHVDSGKATFKQRFSVGIPDRVEGVRETTQKALGAA